MDFLQKEGIMEDIDLIPIHIVSGRSEVTVNETPNQTAASSSSAGSLSRDQVRALIGASIYTVPHSSPSSSPGSGELGRKRSIVWRHFSRVKDSQGSHIDFVSCGNCQTVLSYNGTTTSHMRSHLFNTCSEKIPRTDDDSNEPRRTKKVKRSLQSPASVSKENSRSVLSPIQEGADEDTSELATIFELHQPNIKKGVTEKMVRLCAKDGRPFDIGASLAFGEMAQLFVDIGAKYGSIRVRDIIPSDRTISNNVKTVYKDLFEMVKREIEEPLTTGGFINILFFFF